MNLTFHKNTLMALFAVLAVTPVPAQAGFQWVPPEMVSGGMQTVAPTPMPPPSVIQSPGVISPVIVQAAPAQVMPVAPVVPPMPSASVIVPNVAPAAPVVVSPAVTHVAPVANMSGDVVISTSSAPAIAIAPVAPAVLPPQQLEPVAEQKPVVAITSGMAKEEIVRGFANQVPLSIALKQILPPGYKYSAEADVSMDTAVSFKGGKSWRETLVESLKAVGLSMLEVDRTVRIRRAPLGVDVVAKDVAQVGASAGQLLPLPEIKGGAQVLMPPAIAPSVLPSLTSPVPTMTVQERVPLDSKQDWKAERGDSLRKILSDWCGRSGAELQWLAEYDYPLFASINFNGTFEQAVRAILGGFSGANPQPIAKLHMNPAMGQMVLVVRVRGNGDGN